MITVRVTGPCSTLKCVKMVTLEVAIFFPAFMIPDDFKCRSDSYVSRLKNTS